jgi:dimethylhistidine N-methyltransferase
MLGHARRSDIFQTAHPRDAFVRDVLEGLSQVPKTLPCRYFYDARGSELFERITELEEYYPMRAEASILGAQAASLMRGASASTVLVEFGSGSSRKTELLLAELPNGAAYVAIDVSPDALTQAHLRLARRFPALDIRPVVGDFSDTVKLPRDLLGRPRVGFFPGSTIGNLHRSDAAKLLVRFKALLGAGARLIIGVDLKKDRAVLEDAYNDRLGVTAAFNLNLLARINREIQPVFDLECFTHAARYNASEGRIEMHLVSRIDQCFEICGRSFAMRAGESIHTENSYKYASSEFQALAQHAGWTPVAVWTDPGQLFSVHDLVIANG